MFPSPVKIIPEKDVVVDETKTDADKVKHLYASGEE